MSKDKECLQELVTLFLKINPEPADAQVHALASAVGVDKEELEAIMYSMLADSEDLLEDEADDGGFVAADSQEVLDGDVSPDNMSLDNVALNDGDPTNDDDGFQQETDDDGPDMQDMGIGMSSTDTDDVLSDDGPLLPNM